jgi:hypothetical protein
MMLKDTVFYDVEKVKKRLERCLNLDDRDILCTELEDFYKRLADKKLVSLEEINVVAKEFQVHLKRLLTQMKKLAERDKIDVESMQMLSSILNDQSFIIDEYWDYIPNSMREVFIHLCPVTKVKGDENTFHVVTEDSDKKVSFLTFFKLYVQVKIHKIVKSEDIMEKLVTSLKRYAVSLKQAQDKDLEDELDYEEACEIKKNLKNEGTINWDEV